MKKVVIVIFALLLFTLQACNDSVSQTTTKNDNLSSTTLTTCAEEFINVRGTCRIASALTHTNSLEQLQQDYDQIVHYMEEHNPKLYTDDYKVNEATSRERENLRDGMSQLDFFRVISNVVSAYDDGHTRILLPNEINDYYYYNHLMFPFDTKVVNQKLYITDYFLSTSIPRGSEIKAINGLSIDTIFDIFQRGYSSDGENTTMMYSAVNDNFGYYYFLFIDEFAKTYKIDYIDYVTHELSTKTVVGINYMDVDFDPWEYQPFTYAIMDEVGYIDINSFIAWNGLDEFYDFFTETFQDIALKNIQDIIIDLRDNGGGEPRVSARLFSYLFDEPQAYFVPNSPNSYYGLTSVLTESTPHYNGNIYVLMNGTSFSTTGHFLAILSNRQNVTYIGETAGGRSSCSDSSTQFTLANSGITIQSSNEVWSVIVSEEYNKIPIIPNYEVHLSVEDYLNKEDSVLEFTLQLIRES